MELKPKTIFQIDSAFTAFQWPQISPENQDTMLELLCSLLSPIGRHRKNHVILSKGKRSKKRKRREGKLGQEVSTAVIDPTPSSPSIAQFITVGFNSVTRALESLSRSTKPGTPSIDQSKVIAGEVLHGQYKEESKIQGDCSSNPESKSTAIKETSLVAIFVTRSSQPSVLHAHFPQLIAAASLGRPANRSIRLVQLPKGSEERLCEALGLPRVSFLALSEGAPLSSSLVNLIRECVPPVETPWMDEAKRGKYLPVKINSIETFASVAKNIRSE